jgi:hypothetical protein
MINHNHTPLAAIGGFIPMTHLFRVLDEEIYQNLGGDGTCGP